MAEMSLMESLARGLRGAGGVLSPRVYEDIAASDRQEAALRQKVQMKLYEQKIKDERERALGEAVRPALESGNLDQAAAAAAATPGGFQTGMALLGKAEERKARAQQLQTQLEQRAQDLQMRHEQRLEELQQRGADARALAQERQDFQRQMLQFQQQGQQSLARLTASLRPERQNPIVQTDQGIFERTPQGLVPLKNADGVTLMPPKSNQPKPLTEFQGKSMLYGTRSAEADNILTDLEPKINYTSLLAKQKLGVAGRAAMTEEERQVDQAQRNFVNAVLRQESGAVISDQEFKNAQIQYFPQPNDDEKTIANKRKNRETAIAGFEKMAGPGGEDVAAMRSKKGKKDTGTSGEWGIREKKP